MVSNGSKDLMVCQKVQLCNGLLWVAWMKWFVMVDWA